MDPFPFPDPPLTDGTVTLREKTRDDLDAITAALQDPEIPRWTLVPSPYSRQDAEEWFARSEAMRLEGLHLNLLIVDAGDALLGSIGILREPGGDPAVVEIGYWTAREARGRGVCPRAIVLIRDWAVAELGARRVEIVAHVDNAPSARAAVKVGFADTGERRVAPRTEGATELTHAVYAWEPSSAE